MSSHLRSKLLPMTRMHRRESHTLLNRSLVIDCMLCGGFLLIQNRLGEVDNPLFSGRALDGEENLGHEKSEDGLCIHIFDLHRKPAYA